MNNHPHIDEKDGAHGYLKDADGYTGHVGDINPFKYRMPDVMVLKFQPELTHSIWADFHHRCRSVKSLKAMLLKMTKAGEIVGYRFITIHQETIGVDGSPKAR